MADKLKQDSQPAKSICTGCSNADSWGLPDKFVCKSCTSGSAWEPLTSSSVNHNKPQETEQAKPVSEADKLVYRSIAENYTKDTQKTLHEELGVSEAELEDLRLYKSMVESHGLQIFGLARELKDRLSENPLPKLTKQQAVVLTGYTGVTCCNFGDFHEDLEKRLGRPVFTHEIAMMPEEKIKELYREDFLKLCK